MRVAYLVNRYPSVSHSFIRREIAALERRGVEVLRFSVRGVDGVLPHPGDRHEATLTKVVLDQPFAALLASLAMAALTRPARLTKALARVLAMTPPGKRRAMRAAAYVVEACWLASALRRQGAEHLHAHFGTNSTTVARLAALLAGIPYSFTVHGPEEFDDVQGLGLGAKAADAAFVAAISSFGRSQLLRLLPPEQWDKVQIVRCGLAFGDEAPAAETEPTHDFCFVGRLAPQKGLPTLALALAILKSRGKRVSLRMIGDGELAGWFKAFLQAHDLGGDVELLGSQSEQRVFEVMRASKAVLVPSYAEGLPVVLMEAFANRRPVVTTHVAGIPELVTTDTGLVVPAGDAPALADAMAEACSWSAAVRQKMGASGYKRVRRRHDVDEAAALLHAQMILAQTPPAAKRTDR